MADLRAPFLLEATSALALIVALPLVRYGVARLYRDRDRVVALAVALTAILLCALLHVILMVFLRKLAFGVTANGYTFHWTAELPYEFRKDVVSAGMIAIVFWLVDSKSFALSGLSIGGSVARAPESATDSLKQGLWLRDGTTSFRVDPHDIICVASAGNYVEFSLPEGRRLVRGTLAAEEARLKPFGLIRVHRTRLASLTHVVAVELRPAGDFLLRMDNGDTVAGSRRYREAVISLRNTMTQ